MDIWFSEDIRNALLAASESSAATAAVAAQTTSDISLLWAYRDGFEAALVTIALAFGLAPKSIKPDASTSLEIGDARFGKSL